MTNFEAMGRLDGGKFEITSVGDSTIITFTYYLSLVGPLFVFIIMSLFALAHGDYYAPLIFFAFYAIVISIHLIFLKGIAQEMLNEVVK